MPSLRNKLKIFHLCILLERVPKDSGRTKLYHCEKLTSESGKNTSEALVHHQFGGIAFS